ncbi:MAG: aspartate/glutamate racemase family protein [Candidatus Bathyarchaeia archaeon]
MVKILLILPVSTKKWLGKTRKYLLNTLSPDTIVDVINLECAPESIETYYDSVLAAPLVVDAVIRAEKMGYNAVVIGCFEDPGLHASRELVSIPVLGVGETSIIVSSILGRRIAIISTGQNSRAVYERKMMEMGLSEKLAYSSGIAVPVLRLNEEKLVSKLVIREARKAIQEFNADVIVLGCVGMMGFHMKLKKVLKVPVIDPLLVTVRMAELFSSLCLTHSKAWIYNIPRHKRGQGYGKAN